MCLPLDAVENVFEHSDAGCSEVETRTWSSIAGFDGAPRPASTTAKVVLRTPQGRIGLAIEKCLGVRDVSFQETTPIPTRIVDQNGRPLCHLLPLDGRAYFFLEPRALLNERMSTRPASTCSTDAPTTAPFNESTES